MARRKEAHGGGHGWFVTFADLMGLLVSFFVMLVAFSNQDAKKVQAVAGSMRDAFGVQTERALFRRHRERRIVDPSQNQERGTHPTRGLIRHADAGRAGFLASRSTGPSALAAASLRQALHDMPELTEASKHIMVEETKEGLNIDIVDQDGRSMFPEGSKEPYERTRQLIQKIAGPLKAAPYRISITGHTSGSQGSPLPEYGPWNLSVDRANAVRQILEEEGYPSANIYKVAGKADTDPLFPEDPSIAANRRVTITLIREAPPVPPDLQP